MFVSFCTKLLTDKQANKQQRFYILLGGGDGVPVLLDFIDVAWSAGCGQLCYSNVTVASVLSNAVEWLQSVMNAAAWLICLSSRRECATTASSVLLVDGSTADQLQAGRPCIQMFGRTGSHLFHWWSTPADVLWWLSLSTTRAFPLSVTRHFWLLLLVSGILYVSASPQHLHYQCWKRGCAVTCHFGH